MKENILKDKFFRFAARIVILYKYLCDEKKRIVWVSGFLILLANLK
jgi:hypothetical protein